MASIQDDHGYNQGFGHSRALSVRTERRADYIIGKMSRPNEGARILEIGCGTGEMAFYLAAKTNATVIAIDKCPSFIEQARVNHVRGNLEFDVAHFGESRATTSFKEGSFDYVVGNGILHHAYCTLSTILGHIKTLLKNHGSMVFLEPNILNPYCALIFNQPVFRKMAKLDPAEMAFSAQFIRQHLENAGFSEIDIEYKDFLLPVTPEFLIDPLVFVGNMLERIPLVKKLSQSLFISSKKNNAF
jgi:2-polyprenyl-3-methyl-5-hydroxy-6-metoxy-1,4-benzoquinol methylase